MKNQRAKKEKIKCVVIILMAAALIIIGISYFNSPKSTLANHWNNISCDFEVVNDYAIDKLLSENKKYIYLSDLYCDNNKELNTSVSKVQAYLKDVDFDGGNNPEILYSQNEIKYTYWEQNNYILIYVINDKDKALQNYRDENYTIDTLGNGWYLAFKHRL